MSHPAKILFPREREYRGTRTRPDRWAGWAPNEGDIIISTPAKCGTTWTQSMLTMLLYGTVDLPDRVSALSPWVDSDLEDADHVAEVPCSASGRRVIKTHTPTDGFPIWQGVRVVVVYRHPLDVFLSVRKHLQNMKDVDGGPICGPLNTAVRYYVDGEFDPQSNDSDLLASLTTHFLNSVNRVAQRDLLLMHYADMIRDHRGTIAHMAQALEIAASDALIDEITEATAIDAMRADATKFAPEGGKGFWHNDKAFFSQGGTHQWRDALAGGDIAHFETALAAMILDPAQREWIKFGREGAELIV